ncbi:glycosyltransferase family 2 protein [Acinetobacter variabilis]|uniref:glycosyltransferase family 2 protein n=1 Tax=Acinetobacter variabilis TaxID=70346 RepID=UPI0030F888E0
MLNEVNHNPVISIGIPFYNAEKYLKFAIQSVMNQSYKNWELILVDDGSIDNSLKIAQEFAHKDIRIRVICDGKNRQLPYRLNQLIKESKGKFIARMDADDIMHPLRLEKQLEVLREYSDIDVLGTNAYVIDENNLVFGRRYKRVEGLEKVDGFIHPSIMGKKSWFLDNPYDEKAIRIEDAELWYRAKHHSNFMIMYEPLLFYREFGQYYYKKYFLANISKKYILQKYNYSSFWRNFFRLNKIKGKIYYLANLFNQEQRLINKRNQIVFSKKVNVDVERYK